MELKEYENIYTNEGSHFFYVSNHNIILALVRKYLRTHRTKTKILDAGCGTGLLAKKLEKFGDVWGVDISTEAIRYSKKRGVKAKLASVNKLPFKNEAFDLVVCMDVLYHRKVSDLGALREFKRVLKPGGFAIIRVPANKWLHLNHDKYVHTRQRYSSDELGSKIVKSGLALERLTFVNMILLPLAILKQLAEGFMVQDKVSSGVGSLSELVNKTLLFPLSLESLLVPYIDLPFGLGIVAVCRKSTS